MAHLTFHCRHQYSSGFTLDAEFQAGRGVTALVGPSGTGKTTILMLIAGLLQPRQGRIQLGEQVLIDTDEAVSLPPEQRGVGLVFQELRLFPHLTIERNLRYGQTRRPAQTIDFSEVIQTLELGDLLRRYPATLSGGQRQRVALGRALLRGPKLLLLDEPLVALERELQDRILVYLERALATGHEKDIHLWDAVGGKKIGTLSGHEKDVRGLAFHPDGKTLASAGVDKTVRLWDWAASKLARTLASHTAEVNCVRFSPDGKTLASGSWDENILFWDVASGKLLATLKGHTAFVRDVVFTGDGKSLVSSGKDGAIRLWEVESGKRRMTLEGHDGLVRSLALSPDGKLLASAGRDGTLHLWDLAHGKIVATMHDGVLGFQVVAFAPDGKTLATGGIDRNVTLWDVAKVLALHGPPLTAVEARKKVGEKITVEMTVRSAKDRLEKRGEIYLDCETDFRDPKNFAVVITKTGAASLKKAGIENPSEHFKDKTIRATGAVKQAQNVPRIEIDDAAQIRLVEGGSAK